jgi:hypothetical protein
MGRDSGGDLATNPSVHEYILIKKHNGKQNKKKKPNPTKKTKCGLWVSSNDITTELLREAHFGNLPPRPPGSLAVL